MGGNNLLSPTQGDIMNWMLVVFIVSVASSDKTISTMAIPVDTEKTCTEGKDKLKKLYLESNAASWVLVSECLQVRGG